VGRTVSDHAAVVAAAILQIIRQALADARPELEAILRDEIEDVRREAFREAAEMRDRDND
jgi:hypothetical protein